MAGEKAHFNDQAESILNRVRRDLKMVTKLIQRAGDDGDRAVGELITLNHDILRATVRLELGEPFDFPTNDRPQEDYMSPVIAGQTEVGVVE